MVYINDNNFVHSVLYTIEKRVFDAGIRKKLHEYFTRNTHHMNYDLFMIFSRALGELNKVYYNCKYSNSFILVLLTYLHESTRIKQLIDTDVIKPFIEKFLKKTTESEIVSVDCTEYYTQYPHEFECLRVLTSSNVYLQQSKRRHKQQQQQQQQ